MNEEIELDYNPEDDLVLIGSKDNLLLFRSIEYCGYIVLDSNSMEMAACVNYEHEVLENGDVQAHNFEVEFFQDGLELSSDQLLADVMLDVSLTCNQVKVPTNTVLSQFKEENGFSIEECGDNLIITPDALKDVVSEYVGGDGEFTRMLRSRLYGHYEWVDEDDGTILLFDYDVDDYGAKDFSIFGQDGEYGAKDYCKLADCSEVIGDFALSVLSTFGTIKVSNKFYKAFVDIDDWREFLEVPVSVSGIFGTKTISIRSQVAEIFA